jgi:murein DD-endopeptidase MepM/ murein hydrolase activator NlpD
MKCKATMLFLFVGMAGVDAQGFNTIEIPQSAKPVEIIVLGDPSPAILIEKEHPDKWEKHTNTEKEIRLSRLPLETMVITSSFGKRIDPFSRSIKFHKGIDLQTKKSAVYSILHGEVVQTGFDASLGNFIIIQHGKYTALYGHLSYPLVGKGNKVIPGSLIGISGSTGKSTGDHLHLSIKKGKDHVNPLVFLKAISMTKTKEELLTLLTEFK